MLPSPVPRKPVPHIPEVAQAWDASGLGLGLGLLISRAGLVPSGGLHPESRAQEPDKDSLVSGKQLQLAQWHSPDTQPRPLQTPAAGPV